jgi:peptide/nickel transport system permease protein
VRRPAYLRSARGVVGLAIVVVVVLVALVGPLVAPHAPTAIIGPPGTPPNGRYPLGLDYLGRDVLSRVLSGGLSVLWLSLAATSLSFLGGLGIGLTAGYAGGVTDAVLMRVIDVILCFPPLLFFLIVATSVGTSKLTLVIGVAIVLAPGVARIVYTATKEVATSAYVEAAVMRGESGRAVLGREVLPNILPTVIANFGLTLTFSILLIAAVNFLGIGIQPPAANWALMISENRPIVSINVWATVAPATLIAVLTIGVNLLGDAISHARGRSLEVSDLLVSATATPAPAALSPGEVL